MTSHILNCCNIYIFTTCSTSAAHYGKAKKCSVEEGRLADRQLAMARRMANIARLDDKEEYFFEHLSAQQAEKFDSKKAKEGPKERTEVNRGTAPKQRNSKNNSEARVRRAGATVNVVCIACGRTRADLNPVFWAKDPRFYIAMETGCSCGRNKTHFATNLPWLSQRQVDCQKVTEEVAVLRINAFLKKKGVGEMVFGCGEYSDYFRTQVDSKWWRFSREDPSPVPVEDTELIGKLSKSK
ncbi:hypothetical protein AB5N19_11540 [Seiridium cardinale]